VLEPPETPAPVFAARALKSAFFGTPAPPPEDTIVQNETDNETIGDKDTRDSQCNSMSPTKPPGILLTPGTATTRRKTVSFGADVPDKNEKSKVGQGRVKDGQNTSTQKDRSLNRVSQKTSLTETLKLAREIKPGQSNIERNGGSSSSQKLMAPSQDRNGTEHLPNKLPSVAESSTSKKSNQDLLRELMVDEDVDGDMTMDLNEPHSQSGKYWKSEYQQYHDEATAEMQKLLKYKQLAKSYAKKKDAETVTLTEKLKEEQRRVTGLEDKISKLTAQLTTAGLEPGSDDSPDLIKELAKQTALARQYKAEAEVFRAAGQENAGQVNADAQTGVASSLTSETFSDTRRKARTARENLEQLSSLRQEMKDLRQALSTAQNTSSKLREENARLTQDLLDVSLRLEEQQDKSERRRQAIEEQLQRKTESYSSLQQNYNALKEKAKSQRGSAENLLRKKHDQISLLRKELASMRRAELGAKDLQQHLKKPPADVQGDTFQKKHITHIENRIAEVGLEMKSSQSPSDANSLDSPIPVLNRRISNKSKSPTNLRQEKAVSISQSPAVQAPLGALSEIVNNAGAQRLSSRRSILIGNTSATSRISIASHETPSMDLPSPEPPLSPTADYIAQNKIYKPSPRPSMFTFAPTPPKAESRQLPNLGKLPRFKADGDPGGDGEAHMTSARLPSLGGSRIRTTLPPERAAAARARLEKKNAEKKRVQELETNKENIRH